MGIKEPKYLENWQIIEAAQKTGIPDSSAIFKIDTGYFKKKYVSQNKEVEKWLKDIMQPLQIKAYDKEGVLSLFLVNCHVGGNGKHLTWNREGSFNKFIPYQGLIEMPDSLRSLDENISLFMLVKGKEFKKDILAKNDLTIFVFWSYFMARYSKELIEQIISYNSKHKDKNIEIYYINMDNLFCD